MCYYCGKRLQSIYYGKDIDGFLNNLHKRKILFYGGELQTEYKSVCLNCEKVFKEIAYSAYFNWLDLYMTIGRSCFGKTN